jgi:hypothetical protein
LLVVTVALTATTLKVTSVTVAVVATGGEVVLVTVPEVTVVDAPLVGLKGTTPEASVLNAHKFQYERFAPNDCVVPATMKPPSLVC